MKLLRPLPLLIFVACSDPATPPESSPDAAVADSAVTQDATVTEDAALPECTGRLDPITLSEGGRGAAPIVFDQLGTTATITNLPAGWRSELSADDPPVLSIRAPYGTDGHFDLDVTLDCGTSQGTAAAAVDVRRLSFAQITPWSAAARQGPSSREHTLLWIDEADPNRLLLFGGFAFMPRQYTVVWDVWALDMSTDQWSFQTSMNDPPHRAGGRMAPVPGQRAVLHYGGADQMDNVNGFIERFDYAPDQLSWTTISSASASGEELGSLIYDAPRDRYLSLCGFTGADIHCNVRAFHLADGTWENITVAAGDQPEPRYGFFYAYDAETQRFVMFSGAQYPTRVDPVNPATDTWALELAEDPPRWVKLADSGPPGRRNGAAALDPVGHRFFVFGGTPDAATSSPGLWALDLDRGHEHWTEVQVDNTPPVRSSSTGIYDPMRQRFLFGFGNSTAAIYTDLWALSL